MRLPDAIRIARRARGWSQLDLAVAAGTTQKRVWAVEAGSEPGADMLLRLARALELEVQFGPYVLDGVETIRLAS